MTFEVYGGFEVGKGKLRLATLWKNVNSKKEGLSKACGCYVFAIKHGDSLKPWYIGQTQRKNGYEKEVFSPRNRDRVWKKLCAKNGTIYLYLLPKMTPRGNFVKPPERNKGPNSKIINEAEKMIIELAYRRNPELYNVQEVRMQESLGIPGISRGGPGAPPQAVVELKKMLVQERN